jgi:hypothetical protein
MLIGGRTDQDHVHHTSKLVKLFASAFATCKFWDRYLCAGPPRKGFPATSG